MIKVLKKKTRRIMKKYKLKLVNNCDLKYVLHFLIKNIKSKHVEK